MPLELVTGPANAEKAGVVLDVVRRAAQAGEEPLLVVPTLGDVDRYRRELAGGGVALGVQVLHFGGLLREMAGRAEVRGRALGRLGRERIAEQVAASLAAAGRLDAMAPAATTPGFAPALARFCEELAEARVDPRRFAHAMAIWGRADGRRAFASDLAVLHGAYTARLQALGRVGPAERAWAVLDALRLAPARWGATPVALYGFDDLTRIELDAVRTLAEHVGAPVTVSLPWEPRAAFAGRGRTWHELSELAGERVTRLEASAEHYAPQAWTVLHALERGLFEPEPGTTAPGDGIELLSGGDPRAELELIAERAGRLIDDGVPPGEIVVAARDAARAAPLAAAVFAEAGLELAWERRVPLSRTALGRGLLALLRCALLGGDARDLLVWLRSPGSPGGSGRRLDGLERELRREGITGLDEARAGWERRGGHELAAIERLRAARERGRRELFDALSAEAARMLAAPHRAGEAGTAPLLSAGQRADATVVRELRFTLDELRELEAGDRRLAPGDRELHDLLAAVELRIGGAPAAGAVQLADPLALRARRVDVLFLARLQDGVFPRPGRPEPFLGDEERRGVDRALAAAGEPSLGLRDHEDPLDAERYQLYAAISRPRRLLVLSWHRADEDGDPVVRSPFADDVLDLLDPPPAVVDRRLGSVAWPAGARTSAAQRRQSGALADGQERLRDAAVPSGPPRIGHPLVLAALAERDAWSATELEVYARCPMRWFVERLLRPDGIDPDAEPLSRGRAGHAALELTLRELAEGGERLDAATLDRAVVRLRHHLREHEARDPISTDPRRRLAELGRLEADLVRLLEHQVEVGSSFTPAEFELSFGVRDAPLPAVDLGGLRVRGRIDRVDRSPDGGEAIIVDYKGRTKQTPATKWLDEGLLQAALYARALERLEEEAGTRVVGALLQPVGANPEDMKARGWVDEDADPAAGHADADRLGAEERDALLGAILDRAREIVGEIQSGALRPRPERCSWNDAGCAHPSICRCEG